MKKSDEVKQIINKSLTYLEDINSVDEWKEKSRQLLERRWRKLQRTNKH